MDDGERLNWLATHWWSVRPADDGSWQACGHRHPTIREAIDYAARWVPEQRDQ